MPRFASLCHPIVLLESLTLLFFLLLFFLSISPDTETGGIWDPLGLSQNEGSIRKYRECELKVRVCVCVSALCVWHALPTPVLFPFLALPLLSLISYPYTHLIHPSTHSPIPPPLPPLLHHHTKQHGRVAMAAMLGIFVQGLYQLPDAVFQNPRPLAALQQVYEQRPEAIWQIIVGLGVIELTSGKQKEDRAPGDLGFGASFIPKTEKEFEALQLKELKNGRLAMVASMGALYQEYLTGQGPVEQIL